MLLAGNRQACAAAEQAGLLAGNPADCGFAPGDSSHQLGAQEVGSPSLGPGRSVPTLVGPQTCPRLEPYVPGKGNCPDKGRSLELPVPPVPGNIPLVLPSSLHPGKRAGDAGGDHCALFPAATSRRFNLAEYLSSKGSDRVDSSIPRPCHCRVLADWLSVFIVFSCTWAPK